MKSGGKYLSNENGNSKGTMNVYSIYIHILVHTHTINYFNNYFLVSIDKFSNQIDKN